ncbi:tripartite tricarboxylate transporter TctB family protein [Alcaligenes phenolicus]|uniref:Tripartite tricarboxylate transporter TctB family protein n=1 Tax=Alcaligenes phenolicus TaxID=232846 RepID=A0AAW5VT55_9BURK|nr:tripartite tricarboxylate transporter TctB family protein [Alcaligenes phenolicus]MCX5567164.1 tripartite tricarboxylate transporter TctB family protein [Alcaligenes phenolicus]
MSATSRQPWWLGLAVILAGAICLYASMSLTLSAQYAAIGPGLFVALVGVGLVVLGILFLLQMHRGTAFDKEELAQDPGMDKGPFLTVLLAAVLPSLMMEPLGLPLTATVCFMLVARALGSRRVLLDLLSGLVLGSACWFLFGRLGLQLGGFLPVAGL